MNRFARNASPAAIALERLDAISQRFEAAWQSGAVPRIEDYLREVQAGVTADEARRALWELVLIDQEYRWRRPLDRRPETRSRESDATGAFRAEPDLPQRPLLEDYLARYPLLGSADAVAPEIIAEEYQVRHLWGDRPDQAEYRRRFPRQSGALDHGLLRKADEEVSRSRTERLATRWAGPESPAAPRTAEEFLAELERTGLVSPEDLRLLKSRALEPDHPEDASLVAGDLVRSGKLTPFQAEAVFHGRGGSLVLGNYVFLERLGQGGMGEVYKARHRTMHRTVAIKVLKPPFASDEQVAMRFEREIQALARLKHPNIVTAYDAGQCRGEFFLVMEYVEGHDLASLLKENGPMPIRQAVDYVIQAAQGLDYAHQQGIIHRDVKPGNLLVDRSGVVKVLDLGLSRVREPREGGDEASITQSDHLLGTYDYMAPEQAACARLADVRCDVYSLGCTLYALITGGPVYPRASAAERLLAHRDAPVPSLSAARADIPAPLDAFFQRMIAKSPEHRPQTMAEVMEALRCCLPESGLEPMPVGRGARRWARHWLLAASMIPLFLLLGAILLVSTNNGTVRIEIRDPAANVEVKVDGDRIEVEGLEQPLRLKAGEHFLEIDSPGFKSYSRSFAVRRAGHEVLTISLEPKPRASEPSPPATQSEAPPARARQEALARRGPTIADPERTAAEWALRCGGGVRVTAGGRELRVDRLERLPPGQFVLCAVSLQKKSQVRDADLLCLKGLRGLRELDLGGTGISDIAALADLTQLERLSLSGNRISDASLRSVGGLIRLQSLVLQNCPLITDAGMEPLASLQELKGLDLWGTQVGDSGLKTLSGLRQLEKLNVTGGGITDAGVTHITALKGLRELSIGDTNLTDAGLELLSRLGDLTHLRISVTVVSDAGLVHLGKLRGLTFLDLSLTRISHQGIATLATLPRLAELKLCGDYLTDEGVPHLARCSRLVALDLEGTCVTSSGVRELQTALPGCLIHHRPGPQVGTGGASAPASSGTPRDSLAPVYAEEFLEEKVLFNGGKVFRGQSGGVFVWESGDPGNGFGDLVPLGKFSNGILEVRGRIKEGFGGRWIVVLGTPASSQEVRVIVFPNGAMLVVGDALAADPSWEFPTGRFMHPAVKPIGQWNTLRLVLEATGITVWMNGQRVCKRAPFAGNVAPPYVVSLSIQRGFGRARAEFDRVLFWPTTEMPRLPSD